MFEKEIQFITDFNLNKIKTLGSAFTINELFNSDLHPALTKYISGRMDLMIYEERKILLENSRFDYSGAKIAEYFNLIAEEIKKTRKLSFSEVEEFIKKGVIFNANFSVQPKSTLTNLLYKDSGTSKSTAEIKVYLNYLYYHDYYREIINSYLSKRKIVNLSKDEFRSILDKIDNELLLSKREDIIADALNSISDFYNDGGVSKFSVPPALFEAYLKEKNLDTMVEMLHKEIKDNRNKINISELKKIVFASPPIKEDLPVEEQESEASEEPLENKNDVEILPEMEFQEEEKKAEQEKETYMVEQEKETDKVEEEKEAAKEIKEEKIEEPKVENLPEENTDNAKEEIKTAEESYSQPKYTLHTGDEEELFSEDTILEEEIIENDNQEDEIDMDELIEEDIPKEKKVKMNEDILSFLTQKEIDKIVSSIFNDDEDDFINTMEKISECNNYEQAAEILQSVFSTYRVNPYKREAVTLTNAISNYFHQVN